MGRNQIGSNGKPRTTLIFNHDAQRDAFKGALADIAAIRLASPSEAALEMVLGCVATSRKGIELARTLYASKEPRTLGGLEVLFQELATRGEYGKDASPIVNYFFDIALKLGLEGDNFDVNLKPLKEYWANVVNAVEGRTAGEDTVSELARELLQSAKVILKSFEWADATEAAPLIALVYCSWNDLRKNPNSFRALYELAKHARPARPAASESTEDRLAFLRIADEYYSGEDGA